MKKMIALLLALVMLFSVTACGAKAESTEEATQTTTTEPETETEPVSEEEEEEPAAEENRETVVVEAYIVQADWADAWDEMEARFEEQYPWIDVEAVGSGDESADFIATRNAVNNLPDVTQIDMNNLWRTLADESKVMDLTGRDVCNYIPQSYLDSFTYNGQLLGITQGAAFSVMYYNMQMLNEAGWETVPANWDELLQCCADLQATGYAPLAISGSYHVGLWMLVELILANEVGAELGQGVYEEQFMNGNFDFTAYPELVTKLEAIFPYVLTGSASMGQDDMISAMAYGNAAMCLGGNWVAATMIDSIASCTGDAALAAASLPPFQDEGDPCWISVSPETAFGITADETRSADEQEAAEIFFDWLFLPENFMLIQNARGTVPVLGSMTEEHIVLPDSISGILADMNAAPYVKMGFNLYTAEFIDTASTALLDFLSGNRTAQAAVDTMWATEQSSYFNQ